MHLAILTQYYPPEIGAPQRRLSELAQRIQARGHRVTVLTAMPNYPTGKIHRGYKGLLRWELLDKIEVVRTFIYPTQKASFLHRLTNYFSFVLSSLLLGTFALDKPDYLLVESPPLFLGISALWLSKIKGARLIFNVSDLWPESAARLGLLSKTSLAYRISQKLEALCYQRAWLITGQSHSILGDIQKRFPDRHTYHLSNGVDTAKFGKEQRTLEARSRLSDSEKLVVFYAGLHGLAQGLDQIIEAARALKTEPRIQFVLMGDGPEKNSLIEQANLLPNISFLDPRPGNEIPAFLASADIVLVPLKMYIPGAVPSKLYEAMASGRPVITVATGEPADIVEQHNTGIAVAPGDITSLVEAVKRLAVDADLRAELGLRGRSAAERYFNRDTIAAEFIQYLEMYTP